MAREFLPYDIDQKLLLPPDLQDWLPDDHLARFILEVVDELDLGEVYEPYRRKDARGRAAYHPKMMVALLIYAYCVGRPSSRKIERATYEDVPFRVIAGDQHPDHDTIATFRREHLAALGGLFFQVLRLCQRAGLVKLGHVALDGTKIEANASKRKAMSYGRMSKAEQDLEAEVARLLAEAEQTDEAEDARYGKGRRGDGLPDELARREDRLKRIREAKAALEAEAAAARARVLQERRAEAQRKEDESSDDDPPPRDRHVNGRERKAEQAREKAEAKAEEAGFPSPDLGPRDPDALPSHQVEHDREGSPSDRAQRNFTDPDSRIMKSNGAYIQGYNAQVAVDDAHQVIVAEAVTNQAPDQEHLRPMVGQIEQALGARPEHLSVDAGYWSEANADYCESRGVDAYIATGRLKHGESLPPIRGRPPKDLDAKGRMQRKVRTKKGRAIYARRKAIVEPVIGQTKVRGFRRFSLRGLDKVRGEHTLISTTHNLLKLFRSGRWPELALA